jgi:hypothetical protein
MNQVLLIKITVKTLLLKEAKIICHKNKISLLDHLVVVISSNKMERIYNLKVIHSKEMLSNKKDKLVKINY